MLNREEMIKPDRHINPETSVINISTFILEKLNEFYDIKYDNLLKAAQDKIGDSSKENFPYALNFLFILGKIEYIENSDSFKLLK